MKANVLITDASKLSVRKSWAPSEKGKNIMFKCDLTAQVNLHVLLLLDETIVMGE